MRDAMTSETGMSKEAKPQYGVASKELSAGESYCTCCERDLHGHAGESDVVAVAISLAALKSRSPSNV
jgi:hypothetical protein